MQTPSVWAARLYWGREVDSRSQAVGMWVPMSMPVSTQAQSRGLALEIQVSWAQKLCPRTARGGGAESATRPKCSADLLKVPSGPS